MPATASEKVLFRTELDGDATAMTDAYIDAVFDEAEGDYAGYSREVIKLASYLKGAVHLRNRAARDVDYQQNESSEKLSQRFAQLEKMVSYYQTQLSTAVSSNKPAVKLLVTKKIPTRLKRYPDE